jgi:hypothetical protein
MESPYFYLRRGRFGGFLAIMSTPMLPFYP